MNSMNGICKEVKTVSDRAEKIQQFREEIIGQRQPQRLRVISSRIILLNGHPVTRMLIDGSHEFGRGRCFWI